MLMLNQMANLNFKKMSWGFIGFILKYFLTLNRMQIIE